MSQKLPTVEYNQGDLPNKAVVTNPAWVLSMLEERGGGIRFRDMPLAEMSEALFCLSVLLHKVAANWTGRQELINFNRLILGKQKPEDWTPEELGEARRIQNVMSQLMPCADPVCRFCNPGGVNPGGN